MKFVACAVSLFFLAGSAAWAQEFVAPEGVEIPVRPEPVTPPLAPPSPAIEGIVAEAIRMREPWQLVNPLAPARYGNGENTVSRNPDDPGKPKGFILFALDW